MRLHSLLGVALSLLRVAFCTTEDIENIRAINADFAFFADDKNFAGVGSLFTPNATYDGGISVVQGVPAIEAFLSYALGLDSITNIAVLQQRIVLGPSFDAQGAASTATTLTALNVLYYGQGKLKGQTLNFPTRYTDKLVKTGDFTRYGGWRFTSRINRIEVGVIFFIFFFSSSNI